MEKISFKILLIAIPLALSSCKKQDKATIKNKQTITSTHKNTALFVSGQNLIDSLNQFSNQKESRAIDDKFVISMHEINNKKIALIAITDSILLLFQNIDNNWVQTDTGKFNTYASSFKVQDLNGDSKNDFIVYGFGDIHGQALSYIFISDNNGILHYRPDIHLYNIDYDNKKKIVKSYYLGGANGSNTKESYNWYNDSLKLVGRIEQSTLPNGNTVIKYYKLEKGKQVVYKSLNDSKGIIYDSTLWQGPN